MMASRFQLVMRAGPTTGKFFELIGADITIGRDPSADIVINIPEVSRKHARLRQETGGFVLEDLGSTNGTFVNGQRLSSPHSLRHGDTIMLGEAVALGYESATPQYDPNATIVSSSTPSADQTVLAQEPAAQPPPPAYQSPHPQAQPAFSGQVPAGPVDSLGVPEPIAETDEGKNRTWLWAGLGCLVVLLCVCVVGGILFDMTNMYCKPPFDSLLGFLYSCP
jgi:pSer/pThr/pTyr-binding forkhead associated (FHA) protein